MEGKKRFTSIDKWKGIILFGLNAATYKMALANALLDFSARGMNEVQWDELSESFLRQYQTRLETANMPQQGNPSRLTRMEGIVKSLRSGAITHTAAVDEVGIEGLDNVIPRFQTIGRDKRIVGDLFYEFDFGKKLILKDPLLAFSDQDREELREEIIARWSLLERAFSISASDFELANDIRETYLVAGYDRTSLTGNVPFLSGYQGNTCFYCSEALTKDVHVDHVLPRQVLCHDGIWFCRMANATCSNPIGLWGLILFTS